MTDPDRLTRLAALGKENDVRTCVSIAALGAALVVVVTIGRPLVVLADPNACVPRTWSVSAVPFAFDPNVVAGRLIDVIECDAGPFARAGKYCDPDGDPVTIAIESGPAGIEIEQDTMLEVWTLRGPLAPGVHAIVVRAVDDPAWGVPAADLVTVLVRARAPNRCPVLY